MTMTLEQVRDWLEPRYKNQPDDVYDAVEAAIRERADLWSKWQAERCFREKAEAELATLKERIAKAPVVVVQSAPGAVKASFHCYGCFEYAAENLNPGLRGKRVRLVVEE